MKRLGAAWFINPAYSGANLLLLVRNQFRAMANERIFFSIGSSIDFAGLSGMGDVWSAKIDRHSCQHCSSALSI